MLIDEISTTSIIFRNAIVSMKIERYGTVVQQILEYYQLLAY